MTCIENNDLLNNKINEVIQPVLKKRGRKANTKLINLSPEMNFDTISNLVAHLPLKTNDISTIIDNDMNIEKIEKQIIIDDEHINKILTSTIENNENCSKCLIYEEKIKELNKIIVDLKNGIMDYKSNFNKKIYETKIKLIDIETGLIKNDSDIACWWCCHKFNNIPIGIPEYIIKDTFYIYGCFCSFNCMLAYNYDINDNKVWDRQGYINQMKNKIDPNNNIHIKIAPPRQTLVLFGGILSIEEYRQSFFILNREYNYIYPPLIQIRGYIEEETRDLTDDNKYKINKKEQIMIKRSKPLQKQNINLNSLFIKKN